MARSATPGPQPDDFVGKVVADPANPPNAVLLQGFVGRSDADDHIRVYSDPSLASYVDVPTESVLHSVKLAPEHSPLGGSMLWVDATAPVRPPAVAAPQARAADFLRGSIQADLGAAAAAAGAATAPVQITLLTHQGCCPPENTASTLCTHPNVCPTIGFTCTHLCDMTFAVHCTQSCETFGVVCTHACVPENTSATICTQRCGHTIGSGCPVTGVCARPEQVGPQRGLVGQTGWFGCMTPTHQIGCPRTSTCPPTFKPGCPSTSTCPPTHLLGCGSTSTCPPTHQFGCPSTSTCPHETHIGCVPTWICGPGGA